MTGVQFQTPHQHRAGSGSRSLARTDSSASTQSVPSTSTTSVEQTASVDLLSNGSVTRPKSFSRNANASHFLVLGTDRLLLYADVPEGVGRDDQHLVLARPGTADSFHSIQSIQSIQSLRPASSGLKGSTTAAISLTASVGSPGELMMRGCSDDEESDREVSAITSTHTRCRVAVSINQLVDAVVVNGATLLVVYCPSTHKLNDPYSFKALKSSFSQSFRKRPEKQLRDILEQYPDDSHHFSVRMATRDAAEMMMSAVLEQARKFYDVIVWLSQGFPLPKCDSSVVMLTTTNERATSTYGSSAFPKLGNAVGLPVEVSEGMCGLARGEIPDGIVLTYYLQTPVGMATVALGLLDLERSFVDGSVPVEAVGRLHDEGEGAEDEGEYCWEVTVTFRVSRGDSSIGKSSRTEADAKSASMSSMASPPSSFSSSSSSVQRKVSHGISAPLVVSLVALRAARGVIKGIAAAGEGGKKKRSSKSKKSKKAPSATSKISPTSLYEWSITTLGIDVSLAPRKPKSGNVPRMVSTTHCLDVYTGRNGSSPIDLPPAFETLMQRHASVVTPDIATRFLIGLDSEDKAYTALIKMVDFWNKHDLSSVRPNPLAFHSMKRHYPHGVVGWSQKSDCLITFEAMGKWPDAYKNVTDDSISEEAILHHMLVCYLYNFRVLDPRGWPDGKAIKVMDLDGLRLGHINTAGFKFITSIANVLAIMFPQRMHQCIFINAPSFWNVAWSIMKSVVPEKVRNQMQVFNRGSKDKARAALLEYLDEDELGVLFPEPALDNEYERRLVDYVNQS